MKQYEFHPLAQRYPLLEGMAFEDLCSDIRANGLDKPITLYQGKILDGRNRYRACLEVGLPPRFEAYKGDDPEAFVETQNDYRRHESMERLMQRREERIQRVARKRREGKSTRQIATEEGISESQVRRDLDASGAPPGAPENENGTTTGRDGKKYPAKQPPREREPGDDTEIEEKQARMDEARAGKYRPRAGRKDVLGNTVPDHLRDVFGDSALQESIAEVEEFAKGFRRLHERLKHKIQHFPYALADKLFEALADGEHAAQLVRDSLKPGLPYVLCPSCGGNNPKCKVCRAGCGYLSQWRYEELREQGVITE